MHSLHTFLHAIFIPFLMRAGLPTRRILHCKKSEVTAASAVIATACKDGLIAVNRSCADGAVLEAVIQSIHLCIHALLEQRGLCRLRSLHGRNVKLVLQSNILTLSLCKLTLYAIELKSAQLIKDSLCSSGLSVDNVAGVLRGCISRCTGFCSLCITHIRKTGLNTVESLHGCSLSGETLLHVRNLVCIHLCSDGILSAVYCADNAVTGLADILIDSGNTECSITESACNAVLDSLKLCGKHLIAKTAVDLIRLIHPRIETTIETAESTSETISANKEKQDKKPQSAPVIPEAKTAAVAHRRDRHNKSISVAVIICKCHIFSFLYFLFIYISGRKMYTIATCCVIIVMKGG